MSGMSENKRQNFNSSSDLRLFLLGNIGCGKTSSANTILNQPSSRSADDPKSCNLREAFTDGRRVALVEAPRWYWAGEKVDDSVRKETEQAVALMEPGPHAVLLLIPVNQFTEMESRVPSELREMFGQEVLDHTLVLLTCGDYLMGKSVEEYLQKEDPGLRQIIKGCGGNFHVLNNRNPKDREQVRELLEKVDRMVVKNGVFNMKTAETRQLKSQIEEQEEEQEQEEEEEQEQEEEEQEQEEEEEEQEQEEEEQEQEEEEDERYLLGLMQDQLLGRSETLALNRILGTGALEVVVEEEEEEDNDDDDGEEKEEPIVPLKMRNVEQVINKRDGSMGEARVPNGFPSSQEPELQSHSKSFDDPQLNSTLSSLKADGGLLSKISEIVTSSSRFLNFVILCYSFTLFTLVNVKVFHVSLNFICS
uniref:AIG1-type G domain-containing protein n=1 Tax=Oryzias latipes TaxID=8090 RepID=A0A3P9J2S2_ORYLA